MFKTPEELKKFISWARDNKIKRVKVDNLEFEVSDLAFVEDVQSIISQVVPAASNTTEPEAAKKEEEDLLFWSTNN